ncbi:MAG: polysaccharide export protein [Anderseniella sp.]|nr:polysaccharide export protein [Anderseniella sp.]
MILFAQLLSACGSSSGGLQSSGLSAAPASYGATVQQPVPVAAGSATAYQLGAGDKVKVNVFGEPDLSGEFLVGDNGRVDLPLIGAVQARGQTVTQFQNAVVARYSGGYLKDPKVSVSVLNYRPFFIQGEVGKGGEYPYKAGLTIQNAVAIAGGYTYRANTGKAFVRRAGQDQEVEIQTNQRVAINPGDIIRVPERFF